MVFFWPHAGGVMILGDAAARWLGRLSNPPIYEDIAEGQRSLQKIAAQDFAVAVFGHGAPITRDAAEQFRKRWAQ